MPPSKLAQLRELSVVVADTGDYEAIKRLRPVDCTTNPTLVKKALRADRARAGMGPRAGRRAR